MSKVVQGVRWYIPNNGPGQCLGMVGQDKKMFQKYHVAELLVMHHDTIFERMQADALTMAESFFVNAHKLDHGVNCQYHYPISMSLKVYT